MPRVVINIGGKRFECHGNTLTRWPETLLSELDHDSIFWDEEKHEYFFDRDPKMFSFILNFYRSGELHLPHNVCGPAMKRELEFFGVHDKSVAPCCWKSYNSFSDQERCISMIEKAFGGDMTKPPENATKFSHICFNIWQFLEDPNYSKPAKMFSWVFGGLLILTVAITIMASHKSFRVDNGVMAPENTTNPKVVLYAETEPHLVLKVLDTGLLIFFTLELFVRFITCQAKKKFFKGFFNIIDIVAVLPKWIYFIISVSKPDFASDSVLVYVQGYLSIGEVFRVLRILKLAKNFTGLKVLILTVRASITEMSLVLFLIITGSMMFAVSIYYSEIWQPDTFEDMTVGSYWALITMTTVGYGDTFPKTHMGRFIAVLCAITGIFCTGLPIPIIANNFDLYYSYARIRKAMLEREKERKANVIKRLQLGTKKAFRMAAALATVNNRSPFAIKRRDAGPSIIKRDTDSSLDSAMSLSYDQLSPSTTRTQSSHSRTPRDITVTVNDQLQGETEDAQEVAEEGTRDTCIEKNIVKTGFTKRGGIAGLIAKAKASRVRSDVVSEIGNGKTATAATAESTTAGVADGKKRSKSSDGSGSQNDADGSRNTADVGQRTGSASSGSTLCHSSPMTLPGEVEDLDLVEHELEKMG